MFRERDRSVLGAGFPPGPQMQLERSDTQSPAIYVSRRERLTHHPHRIAMDGRLRVLGVHRPAKPSSIDGLSWKRQVENSIARLRRRSGPDWDQRRISYRRRREIDLRRVRRKADRNTSGSARPSNRSPDPAARYREGAGGEPSGLVVAREAVAALTARKQLSPYAETAVRSEAAPRNATIPSRPLHPLLILPRVPRFQAHFPARDEHLPDVRLGLHRIAVCQNQIRQLAFLDRA